MKSFRRVVGAMAVSMVATGSAQAALIGVTQAFPDITFTASPYLIYDHDGAGASTGRLQVVTGATQLAEGAAAGGSTLTQSYLSAGDTIPDLMLIIDIDNTTGDFVGGNVSIGFGTNPANTSKFSWTGVLTDFGFQSGTGNIFDATWTMTNDDYLNMPATLSQFVDGYLTGGAGGLKINSSAAWGTTANFGNDWIFGSAATTNPYLASFTGGLTSPLKTNSTITVDAFVTPVPLPAGVWLLTSGLAAFGPLAWRGNTNKKKET